MTTRKIKQLLTKLRDHVVNNSDLSKEGQKQTINLINKVIDKYHDNEKTQLIIKVMKISMMIVQAALYLFYW